MGMRLYQKVCVLEECTYCSYSKILKKMRLKHRPSNVPEPHFRQLCEYWSLDIVKATSERNKRSRAKQKWRHRMGPRNFAITRENLRAKEKREPTQAEIFIETRKGNKGKQLDPEIKNTISRVQQLVENEEYSGEALQAVLGKEHPGMMRCMGRNVTKTSLKQKEKINALKQAHNEEVASLNEKMENLGDTVGKLQYAFNVLLQQCRPGISVESLEDLIGISPGDINSSPKIVRQPHFSTSTHVPHCRKNDIIGEDEDDVLEDYLDEFQDEEL